MKVVPRTDILWPPGSLTLKGVVTDVPEELARDWLTRGLVDPAAAEKKAPEPETVPEPEPPPPSHHRPNPHAPKPKGKR